MTAEIETRDLGTFEVSPDGASIRLGFIDAAGDPASVVLPLECIGQLCATLPRMAQMALVRQYRDPSLRYAFPLGKWRLESAGTTGGLILTMETRDGFEACYALGEGQFGAMLLSLGNLPADKPAALVN